MEPKTHGAEYQGFAKSNSYVLGNATLVEPTSLWLPVLHKQTL